MVHTSSKDNKKKEEEWYLCRFLTSLDNPPTGDVMHHESPDFIIKNQDRTLGIEVTKFFIQSEKNRRPRQNFCRSNCLLGAASASLRLLNENTN